MGSRQTRQTHILVVEDDPLVAGMLMDALGEEGHVVERAANGRIALEMIEGRSYDLVVSDLRMPELDGVGLYEELVRRQPGLLTPLIFVTGSKEHPRYRCFLARTDAPVLSKPFNLGELQELTRRLLSYDLREGEMR
ncbi:MAG: response regulator [Vicinamibacteria bacterium]